MKTANSSGVANTKLSFSSRKLLLASPLAPKRSSKIRPAILWLPVSSTGASDAAASVVAASVVAVSSVAAFAWLPVNTKDPIKIEAVPTDENFLIENLFNLLGRKSNLLLFDFFIQNPPLK